MRLGNGYRVKHKSKRNTLLIVLAIASVLLACTATPIPTATPKPTPTKPASDYSIAQLVDWDNDVGEVLSRVPGIVGIGLDEGARRITIRMAPRRGARAEIEAALSTLDAPRDAFAVDVGCAGAAQRSDYLTEIVDGNFRDSTTFSVEAVHQVPFGTTISLRLALRNTGDRTITFQRGGRPSHDFVISASNGDEVWHWMCAKVRRLSLVEETLEPGELLELYGEWEQVDNRGNPVPSGEYVVRGVLFMESPEKLVTSAHKVEVLPASDKR